MPTMADRAARMTFTLRNVAPKLTSWLRSRSWAQVDLAVIAVATLPLYVILFRVNAFDLFHDWSRDHENWQLDEIIVLAFFLGLAAMVFSWRRLRDLKRERIEKENVEQDAYVSARRDPLPASPTANASWRKFQSGQAMCQ